MTNHHIYCNLSIFFCATGCLVCLKIVRNIKCVFSKAQDDIFKYLALFTAQNIQFTVIEGERNQEMFTVKHLAFALSKIAKTN